MKNQSGFITVDFIFAIVLIMGFTVLLFLVSFTLSVASITQYITYAAARNYVVAHLDQDTQKARGEAKYQELIHNKVFKPLYANGWYHVDPTSNCCDHTKIIPGYDQGSQGVNEFWGIGTHFVAPVLDFKIPFFGSTAPDSDGSGAGFKTYIGSYLGREPSADECIQFTNARWEAIRNIPVSNGAAYSQGTSTTGYFPMTDDGC